MRIVENFNFRWSFSKQAEAVPAELPAMWDVISLPHCWNAVDGQDGGNDYYRGTCDYAKSFHKLDLPEALVKSVFELRAACLAGYTPDLFGCHICGSQNPDRFDLSAGQLECRACRSGEASGIRMPISPGILEAMRYICLCDPKKLFSFHIGVDTLMKLSSLTEAYLTTQLERGFSTLDFYKSLLI